MIPFSVSVPLSVAEWWTAVLFAGESSEAAVLSGAIATKGEDVEDVKVVLELCDSSWSSYIHKENVWEHVWKRAK